METHFKQKIDDLNKALLIRSTIRTGILQKNVKTFPAVSLSMLVKRWHQYVSLTAYCQYTCQPAKQARERKRTVCLFILGKYEWLVSTTDSSHENHSYQWFWSYVWNQSQSAPLFTAVNIRVTLCPAKRRCNETKENYTHNKHGTFWTIPKTSRLSHYAHRDVYLFCF